MVNLPKAAGETAGATAGSFLGGLANNPAIVIIALVLGGLFIFRDRISEGLGSLGENFGKIELPDIQLPTINFPAIEFPTFEFPTFEFPDINIDFGDPLGAASEAIGGVGEAAGDFFGDLTNQFNQFIAGFTPKEPLTEEEQFDFSGLEGGVSPMPTGEPAPPFSDAAIFAQDFPEEFVPITPTLELPSGFVGGGVSFEGGTIFATPIANLSLSKIIDQFDVTASQAADILAQAQDNFGDFDFGTNTGSGIFGTPTGEENIITGGATLESEAQKAAELFQKLFGNVQNPDF